MFVPTPKEPEPLKPALKFRKVPVTGKTIYLFTQDYTKGVYDFFKNGKSTNELKQFKKWRRNPRLDKTIEKIPIYRAYVMREIA